MSSYCSRIVRIRVLSELEIRIEPESVSRMIWMKMRLRESGVEVSPGWNTWKVENSTFSVVVLRIRTYTYNG